MIVAMVRQERLRFLWQEGAGKVTLSLDKDQPLAGTARCDEGSSGLFRIGNVGDKLGRGVLYCNGINLYFAE